MHSSFSLSLLYNVYFDSSELRPRCGRNTRHRRRSCCRTSPWHRRKRYCGSIWHLWKVASSPLPGFGNSGAPGSSSSGRSSADHLPLLVLVEPGPLVLEVVPGVVCYVGSDALEVAHLRQRWQADEWRWLDRRSMTHGWAARYSSNMREALTAAISIKSK